MGSHNRTPSPENAGLREVAVLPTVRRLWDTEGPRGRDDPFPLSVLTAARGGQSSQRGQQWEHIRWAQPCQAPQSLLYGETSEPEQSGNLSRVGVKS